MSQGGSKRLRLVGVLAAALCASACASTGRYLRPKVDAGPVITDEATGRTFTDCREAFAAATFDTVLTFSAGVFPCGPEVTSSAPFLVVRGAGLGKTFLEAGGGEVPTFTVIRPGGFMRVQDIAFGGLTELASVDTRVALVRVAIAGARPVLIGGESAGVLGSVIVAHSILAAGPGASQRTQQPTALAFGGNDRVAVLESVFVDVEQEFETFPSPGSVVLLGEPLVPAFERHEPGARRRPRASIRPNVPCTHPASPRMHCLRAEQLAPDEGGPIDLAAARLSEDAPLASAEPYLREAARGFRERMRTTLGPAIRQPDVFWWTDKHAAVVEEEALLTGRDAMAVFLRARIDHVVSACADEGRPMKATLASALALDRLLRTTTTGEACRAHFRARTEQVLVACSEGWDWAKALADAKGADDALGTQETSAACRTQLSTRARAAATGPLSRAYLSAVSRELGLAPLDAGPERPTIDALVKYLPWVVTKSGRVAGGDTVLLDRIARAATSPNAGDGRRLIETTPSCRLLTSSGPRAQGAVELAIERPGAKEGPESAVSLAVESSRSDLPAGLEAGAVNVALVKKCADMQAAAYPFAVRRFVLAELARVAVTDEEHAADVETALLLSASSVQEASPLAPKRIPALRAAIDESIGILTGRTVMKSSQSAAPADGVVLPPPEK